MMSRSSNLHRINPQLLLLLLSLGAALLCGSNVEAALRLRHSSRFISTTTTPTTPTIAATTSSSTAADDQQAEPALSPPSTEEAAPDAEPLSGKHKRGILHGAGGHWPGRTYAAQYGYSLQLPAAATFLAAAPAHRHHAFLKYPTALAGFHLKQYAPAAPAAFLPAVATPVSTPVSTVTGALPAVSALPAVGGIAAAVAAAPSYVLRPGNAVVSSYSVNYPHQHLHRPVKPVHFHHAVQVS